MKYLEARQRILTGDLVLSSGSSAFSKIIKEVTGSKWSHAAMAAWGEDIGCIPRRLYVWESKGRGVSEDEFIQAQYTPNVDFLSRITNPGAGDVGIRFLSVERTPQMLEKLARHCLAFRGKPYQQEKIEMLQAVPWLRPFLKWKNGGLESQFCWEAVAATWQAMGLLPLDRPACTYSNTDLASDTLVLLPNAVLSELIPVEM